VVPQLIGGALGGSAVIACTFRDALLLNDAWMLNLCIRRVGPLKQIILVRVYDVWSRHVSYDVRSDSPPVVLLVRS
jgi:hypothetical protein